MSPLLIVCATLIVLACLLGSYLTTESDKDRGFGIVALAVIALTALGVWKMR